MADVEYRVSGFAVTGDWGDVVEHGERITAALQQLDVDEEALEEWEEWRPKVDERLDDEINDKTSEQASIKEGEGEQAGKAPTDDLQNAGEKLEETYEKLDDEETSDKEAMDDAQDSIGYAKRAADTVGRQAIRKVEDTVYRKVMTQLAPYYFDNELVSANISKTGGKLSDEVVYEFEVNINDDDLKDKVAEKLKELEDEVERWHVESPKNTESQEQADGVTPPEDEEAGSLTDIEREEDTEDN